jgi:hypothetical protein
VPGLLQRLADVPDPRDHRGQQHSLVGVLAVTRRHGRGWRTIG